MASSISAPTTTEQPLAGWNSNASIWIQETPPQTQKYPPLMASHTTAGAGGHFDVIVVGGGIVGVTTAFLLKQSGKKVALVEARRIGCGTTGSSTCKLTSQQNLIYTALQSKYDEATAKLYGEMQETAITQVEELVRALKIDCDFARKPHATWTSDPKQVAKVQAEYELAKKLGLPAELVSARELELPASIGVRAAVRFQNQGEFNSYKFVSVERRTRERSKRIPLQPLTCTSLLLSFRLPSLSLSSSLDLVKHVDGDGCRVFEGTLVSDVKESAGTHIVSTETGASLQGDRVILATHLPILDRSGHFAMFLPSKSHVVAVRLAKGDGTHDKVGTGDVQGMYINCDPEKRSLRTLQGGSILVVSGESFETGDETEVDQRYAALEAWAHRHFQVERNLTRWSAMDYSTSSLLPYIGHLSRGSETIYTATAFSKWGLTNGVAAAILLRDLLTDVRNPWADMVDARRWDLSKSAGGILQETVHTQKHLLPDKVKARFAPTIDTLRPGEGGTVKAAGETVGAYLDRNERYHLVTPVCTHMGCNVLFNATDRTWESVDKHRQTGTRVPLLAAALMSSGACPILSRAHLPFSLLSSHPLLFLAVWLQLPVSRLSVRHRRFGDPRTGHQAAGQAR